MHSESAFMLLVWDVTIYSQHSPEVSPVQYGDVLNLFVTYWPLSTYTVPTIIEYGG